jgi:hypothetical protein
MIILAILLGLVSVLTPGTTSGWQTLAPGMDLKVFTASKPSSVGDSRIVVVRIDPHLWELEFVGMSRSGEDAMQTVRAWSGKYNLSAAINAGMFLQDYKTHVGYLRFREHVNSGRMNPYQSIAAFDPRDGSDAPGFRIFDLDELGVSLEAILDDYASVVQNLRLIKRPGLNRWSEQPKQWSEAALGEDNGGRILFIFSRSPFSMHDLNHELLSADIGLVAAQHLEGGPEAQLYLRVGEVEFELTGSYETAFIENNGQAAAWPVPNVLGVRPRSPETD